MPKYVVHVGPSKTGTTYLQSSLYHTRNALQQHGIAYPPNWWKKKAVYHHEALVNKIAAGGDAVLEQSFADLNASDLKMVVLSSEGFPTLSRADLERFRDLLGGNAVEIVYYCRRWSDRLPSAWQQVVKRWQH